jgi:hypothetical protein
LRAWELVAEADRNMETFNMVFCDFLTAESGSLKPSDDHFAYLATDDCKKLRKVDARSHANRIETLCLYANGLEGVKAILTDAAITMVIINSFPNPWLNEFQLAQGNPVNSGQQDAILKFFMTKKAVQDSAEDNNKKLKKEEKEKELKNGRNTTTEIISF